MLLLLPPGLALATLFISGIFCMDMVVGVERTTADRSKTQIKNVMNVVILNTKLQRY